MESFANGGISKNYHCLHTCVRWRLIYVYGYIYTELLLFVKILFVVFFYYTMISLA